MANPKRPVSDRNSVGHASGQGFGKSTLISIVLLFVTIAILIAARFAGVFGGDPSPEVAPTGTNTATTTTSQAQANEDGQPQQTGQADGRIQGHVRLTASQRASLNPQPKLTTRTFDIAGEAFELELAVTHAQRYKGLSDRQDIGRSEGMLFVFPDVQDNARAAMVMRDCLFDIDLIYLNDYGFIVGLHQMKAEEYGKPDARLTPYRASGSYRYAIELPTGTIARLGLKRSDQIKLPFDELKAMAE